MNGLGPLFMNIWTCGSSPLSGSWNLLRWIKSVSGASRLSKTWKFIGVIKIISSRDWWPWKEPGYITMTQRQRNNQWSGGKTAHLAQTISECKNPLDKFPRPHFWIQKSCCTLIIFQGAKLSTLSITHPCLCNWRIFFERKTPSEILEGNFVLARPCPGSPHNSKKEETSKSWSPTLFTVPGLLELPPVDWTKNKWKSPFFVRQEFRCFPASSLNGKNSEFFEWLG